MTNRERRANRLFDFACEQPNGFTREEGMAEIGGGRSDFTRALRDVRVALGEDEINVVSEPRGASESWRYRLVGTWDEAAPWAGRRTENICAQLTTVYSVAGSIVAATDGRTFDGRRARLVRKVVGRLVEDLAELRGD